MALALNTETIEEGVPPTVPVDEGSKISMVTKRWLTGLSLVLNAIGSIGGPILLRMYFLNGGARIWTASWIQAAGFPVLLGPLIVFYIREHTTLAKFLAPRKLFVWSIAIGLISGPVNLMISYSSSYLPVSTSQLLLCTQLAFTAFFSGLIVKQKFTPYIINAVVLLTAGPILLGLMKNSDRPPGVSNGDYMLGFFLALGAAALVALSLPCSEFAYGKINKRMTCPLMLQFLFGLNFTSAAIYSTGMLINKDFRAIPREAVQFNLGATKYYVVLASSALLWQASILGTFALIYLTSSIFMGVFGAALVPITEIIAAIVFNEKFTGEKGMAVFLCLWGFTSYLYGSHLEMKKQTQIRFKNEPN